MNKTIGYSCAVEPLDNTDVLLGSEHKFLILVVTVSSSERSFLPHDILLIIFSTFFSFSLNFLNFTQVR